MEREGQKDLKVQNGSKKKKGQKKKSRRGHGYLCCVCCKNGSMERKVT
jgi:hypothetical protein